MSIERHPPTRAARAAVALRNGESVAVAVTVVVVVVV
jgi:hypothetical protein